MKFKVLFKVLLLLMCAIFSSCVSLQIITKAVFDHNRPAGENTFFLKPLEVTAYNFYEKEEVSYILEKKLYLTLSSIKGIKLVGKEANYQIEPELLIKGYEEKYERKNYYLLNVRIREGNSNVALFSYEYNGSLSIFDGRVQNAMIDKFIKDLEDFIKL